MAEIHKTSIVAKGARLAKDVVVGPFCTIGPKVKVAAGVVIHSNVTIEGTTTIGADCELFPMSSVGITPNGSDSPGKCVLGKANAIREHVTVYAGTGRTATLMGNDNLIMIGSTVGSAARLGDHNILANVTHLGAGALIDDYVRMSAFSYVEPGMSVGSYSFVAGFGHIDRNAPPFAMLQGSPYRVRGVNSHNLKSCGFGDDDVRELKRLFRDIFNGTGSVHDEAAQQVLSQRGGGRHVKALRAFLKESMKDGADND